VVWGHYAMVDQPVNRNPWPNATGGQNIALDIAAFCHEPCSHEARTAIA